MKQQSTLTEYISQSIRDNWNLPALTNIDAVTYRYSDVAVKIAKYHLAFAHAGVAVGDKIAFCDAVKDTDKSRAKPNLFGLCRG